MGRVGVLLDELPILQCSQPIPIKASMMFLFDPKIAVIDQMTKDTADKILRSLIAGIDESDETIFKNSAVGNTSLHVMPHGAQTSFRILHARAWKTTPLYTRGEYDKRVMFSCTDPPGNRQANLQQMRHNLFAPIMAWLPEILARREEIWHRSICCGLKSLLNAVSDIPSLHKMIEDPIRILLKEHHSPQ